jgi:hypothetical protein
MITQKGSATTILLVVLVVILAGVLVYFGFLKRPGEVVVSPIPTPTSVAKDETAGWKTYHNEKFGLEFEYPQGLDLSKVFSITDYSNIEPGPAEFYQNLAKSAWQSALAYQDNYKVGDGCRREDVRPTVWEEVEGIPGAVCHVYKLEPLTLKLTEANTVEYIIYDERFRVSFDYTVSDGILFSDREFDQILSTFKFIK